VFVPEEKTPMAKGDSFDDVMARLRGGDEVAAAEVFHRFASRLIVLAGKHLDGRLRQVVDAEDVLQSVYRTFFRRHGQEEFAFDGWGGLWALLTVLTVRKCGRWREHFTAAVRDVDREVARGGGNSLSSPELEALAREPSPLEAAALADRVEALLRGLEGRDRDIVTLRLQGFTPAEIAAQLGRPERTVFRVLDRVKKRLRRLCGTEAEPG
jgi:RNA polymerase sigma-70 factor (ECF subfamily)